MEGKSTTGSASSLAKLVSVFSATCSTISTTRRILDDVAEAEHVAAGEYAVVKGELVITAPILFGRLHMVPVV